MKYVDDNRDSRCVLAHLANKNLHTTIGKRTLADKIARRICRLYGELDARSILKHGFGLVASEQVVENTLAISNMRPTDKSVLDFGAFEGILPLQLTSVGYKVTVLDQRKYPFQHPNLRVFCWDLFSEELPIGQEFDAVISISTIEHLGLGSYGDIVVEDADKLGVERLWGLLKSGGRLMASVPAGKQAVQGGYRVYDQKRLKFVFPHATAIRWFVKDGREGAWQETAPDAIENLEYSEPLGQRPVEAVAFIICDKAK